MWFRNLRVFRLRRELERDPDALHALLDERRSRPCGPIEMSTLGWVPPAGDPDAPLVRAVQGRLMVCLRREEKIVPAAAVNELMEQRLGEREAAEGRPLGRREKIQLKEELLQELLPRALVRSDRTHAYVDPAARWLVVDAASAKRAEELVSTLRASLGSLPVVPLTPALAPSDLMTRWLQQRRADGEFGLLGECELREVGEGSATIKARGMELAEGDLDAQLAAGMRVVRLALGWAGRLECVLDDELALRRLRFDDRVRDEAGTSDEEPLARFDADFALMAAEIDRLLQDLVALFGEAGGE